MGRKYVSVSDAPRRKMRSLFMRLGVAEIGDHVGLPLRNALSRETIGPPRRPIAPLSCEPPIWKKMPPSLAVG
jgi:hypothetical protein